MVDVVAAHRLDDRPQRHRSAFRVGHGAVAVALADRGEQLEVPAARGRKERKAGGEVVGSVPLAPLRLVEGLQDMVVLSERLAQAEGEDEFAVGKVGNDLADGPLAGSRLAASLLKSQRRGEGAKTLGSRRDDSNWVLPAEVRCVRVELHD